MKRSKKKKNKKINITNKDWLEKSNSVGGVVGNEFYDDKKASHLDSSGKGIFNEVSFNVLENAAAQSKKDSDNPNIGYTHRTVMSSDELLYGKSLNYKKKKQKKSKEPKTKNTPRKNTFKTVILSCVCTLAVLFLAIGSMYFSGVFGDTQEMTASKIIMNSIASNDIVIIRLDQYLSQNLEEARVEDYYIEQEDIDDAKASLEKCKNDANEIINSTEPGSDENYASSNAAQAAYWRIEMLDCGSQILKMHKEVHNYLSITDSFWNDLLDSNDYIIAADELSSNNNAEDLDKAISYNQQAIDCLNSAKDKISFLISMQLSYDFSGYLNYTNLRIEAAQASILSLNALKNQDTDTTVAQNAIYVEKESAAADMAENVDTNPTSIIRTNYDIEVKPYIDKYKNARLQAATIDSMIRNYLKL